MKNLIIFIYRCFRKIRYITQRIIIFCEKQKLGCCGKNVRIGYPNSLNNKMFIEDNVLIHGFSKFIIGPGGKLVIKRNTICSNSLTVITGEHGYKKGCWRNAIINSREKDSESSVVIGEDVLIGANVTLLPNVIIGRGAQIGACSVVTKEVPPYAVVAGSPARVLRFIFSPEEIIEHEKQLYPINDRLDYNYLKALQQKYGIR